MKNSDPYGNPCNTTIGDPYDDPCNTTISDPYGQNIALRSSVFGLQFSDSSIQSSDSPNNLIQEESELESARCIDGEIGEIVEFYEGGRG